MRARRAEKIGAVADLAIGVSVARQQTILRARKSASEMRGRAARSRRGGDALDRR
jgi:hypothetical protein